MSNPSSDRKLKFGALCISAKKYFDFYASKAKHFTLDLMLYELKDTKNSI